ncbi:MAG TPA: protoglobin domain-containing protein [Kofleriaceae bacterium]|nr:protoglobin domain-containing protein [Kofleriaceae bacterium]
MRIPGYTFGTSAIAPSPVKLADFEQMKASVLFGDDDVTYLRRSLTIVQPQVEAILDVWYGFVGSQPHLLASFTTAGGEPIGAYLDAVRKRFGQWILDTARAEYDQTWLDYQHEIGLRHHRAKKNQTDGASSSAIVAFRNLVALVFPITFTLRPFLAQGGQPADEVDKMYAAWLKSCLLQITLWSHPYVKDGDF